MVRDDRAVGVSSTPGQSWSEGSNSGPPFAGGSPTREGDAAVATEAPERGTSAVRGDSHHGTPSLSWLVFSRLIFPGIFLFSGIAGLLTLREAVTPDLNMEDVLRDIEQGGTARAEALAKVHDSIFDHRYRDLRSDPRLADALIQVLETELRRPVAGDAEFVVIYRAQLCRLVRELETPRIVPVLLVAAESRVTDSPQMDSIVRRAAAEGVVMAMERHGPDCVISVPGGTEALCRAAKDPVPPVRAAAAAALGYIGGKEVCAVLREMLHDDTDVVRYNAAISLAYAGESGGLDTLHEFLRSENVRHLAATGSTDSVIGDRTCKLLGRSLAALDRLSDRSSDRSLSILHPAMEDICLSRAPEHVRTLAMRVDLKIQRFLR